MKTKLLIFFTFLICYSSFSQIVNIPDNNFKNYLINNNDIDTNYDNEIQFSEATSFTGEITIAYSAINDLTGLEAFVNISSLSLYSCSLSSINISNNLSITKLDLSKNNLTTLDISLHPNLEELVFSENNISSLDVSMHTSLTRLECAKNNLTSLNLSTNTLLETVVIGYIFLSL